MTKALSPEELPERIGFYRLEGRLGSGGMGEVYRGWDERLERPVALKRLLAAEEGSSFKSRERFRREARSVARVSHSAIVQIYDWIEDEAADWIVMELVDGSSLRDLVADGPMPPKRVARIGQQIAAGLAAAHKVGLVHRDLKAENVMMTSAGEIRILDFGLAKRISQEDGIPLSTRISETGEVVGTVTAMSPEQALGQPVDHRTDLFSLGSLLYHLVTGVLPFTGDNTIEVLTRICTVQAVPVRRLDEEIPEDLARIIEGCLEKEPAHRPQTADVLAEALEAAALGLSPDNREVFSPRAAAARAEASTGKTKIGDDSLVVSGLLDPATPPLPTPEETGAQVRTLLLSDLVDSTKLIEKLGDEHAARIFGRHDRLARDILKENDGREIDKSDGFLMLFKRPIDAVRFALGYHAALAEISEREGVDVTSRVGIHVGEVMLRTNTRLDVSRGAKPLEVEGLAKAMAARLMSLAGPRQTLISRGVYDLARRAAVGAKGLPEVLSWLEHGRYRMQGVEDPVEVFEVGVEGASPLAAPEDTKKVARVAEEKGVFLTHRRLAALAAAAILIPVIVAIFRWWRAPEPLEIAVLAPQIGSVDESVTGELVASAIRGALSRRLIALEGISLTPGDQTDAVSGSSLKVAKALAVDEVIASRFDCALARCQVSLSRISAAGGDVLWGSSFSSRADDLLKLHNAVVQNFARSFPGRRVEGGIVHIEVHAADYASYLELLSEHLSKDKNREPAELLAEIDEIQKSSPRFLDTYLLEAAIAILAFYDNRDESLKETAFAACYEAHELAPLNPDPLFVLAMAALDAGDLEVLESAIDKLTGIARGHPRVQALEAFLLERRGETQQALRLMREAMDLLPSLELSKALAAMEYRHGNNTRARALFERMLDLQPNDFTVRLKLANVELLSGSPNRAIELFKELVDHSPEVGSLINLGVAYMLVERWPEANAAFEHALELAPSLPSLILNLADTELLVGRLDEAQDHYREVVAHLDRDPHAVGGVVWQGLTVKGQALAHLGEVEAAVLAAQEALDLAPDNPQVAAEVATIYALVGERASALVNLRKALAAGVDARWFGFPWFDDLRNDPRFREILQQQNATE